MKLIIALIGITSALTATAGTARAGWQPLPDGLRQEFNSCECDGRIEECKLSVGTFYGNPPNESPVAGPGDYLYVESSNGGVKITKDEFDQGDGKSAPKAFYAKYFPNAHGGHDFGKQVLKMEGQELLGGKIHIPADIRAAIKDLGKFDINAYSETSYKASGSKITKTVHWYFTTSLSRDTTGVTETWEYDLDNGKVTNASYKVDGSGYDKISNPKARRAFKVIEFAHGLNSYHAFKESFHGRIECKGSPSDPPASSIHRPLTESGVERGSPSQGQTDTDTEEKTSSGPAR